MGVSPSATLRVLCVVGAAAAGTKTLSAVAARSFFKASEADGLVKGVRQHSQLRADGWHVVTLIEHGLGGGDALVGELVSLPGHWRTEEASRAFVAELLAATLHGDKRHSEGTRDLSLRGVAIGDELAGEEAE